ncbi:MAG: hypothetical protein J6M34_03935 [Clostridia bacterium]|nr:hypothetical protein [Clostridia bacterium]
MNRIEIMQIAGTELSRLTKSSPSERETVFRRPSHEDEIDRLGRKLVKRMMEAGVIEPL